MITQIPKKNRARRRGYTTLISVLFVGAIGSSVVLSLILLGLGSSRTSFAFEQSIQAKSIANACAEEALQRIVESATFSGTGALTFEAGNCQYTVVDNGGSNRTVTSVGIVGTIQRKVEVIIDQVRPKINVNSWKEVSNF